MWLLDANLDLALIPFLRSQGVNCEAAALLQWGGLTNGQLSSAAVEAGYTCLLTRDRRFAESAAGMMRGIAELAIVVVTLAQQPSSLYLDSFRAAWSESQIKPVAGEAITWP